VGTAGRIHAEAGRADRTSAIFARRVASEDLAEHEGAERASSARDHLQIGDAELKSSRSSTSAGTSGSCDHETRKRD